MTGLFYARNSCVDIYRIVVARFKVLENVTAAVRAAVVEEISREMTCQAKQMRHARTITKY